MKPAGIVSLLLVGCLIWWNFQQLSFLSIGIGIVLGSSFFLLIAPLKVKEVSLPDVTVVDHQWKIRMELLEAEKGETIASLQKEMEKLEQKIVRANERCLSYQNLVNAHQEEIDKLTDEKKILSHDLISKDRKLSEALLARLEPELFDLEKLRVEAELRELKIKFEEKVQHCQQLALQLSGSHQEVPSLKGEEKIFTE
jgi:chromosome segregation ATPase